MTPRWQVRDDLPRHLSLSDYEAAKLIVEEVCQRHGIGREGVGFFGNVGYPGVSDIDVVIVGDTPRLSRVIEDFEKRCEESDWLRSMFRHPPLYLLDDALEIAPRLHTLVGLSGPLRGQLLDGPTARGSRASTSYDAVLHGIWMLFLIHFVSGLWRRRVVSARTLLLVHKNLEYSERYFLGLESGAEEPPTHRSSDTVRALALEERRVDNLATDFTKQFEAAQRAFAGFCREEPIALGQWASSPLLVSRRFVCIRGAQTAVRRFESGWVGLARPWPFEVTRRFARGDQGEDDVGQFIRASILARAIYWRAGIRYPFVGPFGLLPPLGRQC